MQRLILILLAMCVISGCMTVQIDSNGFGAVTVNLDKAVSTSTLPVQANGNTVPISALP